MARRLRRSILLLALETLQLVADSDRSFLARYRERWNFSCVCIKRHRFAVRTQHAPRRDASAGTVCAINLTSLMSER